MHRSRKHKPFLSYRPTTTDRNRYVNVRDVSGTDWKQDSSQHQLSGPLPRVDMSHLLAKIRQRSPDVQNMSVHKIWWSNL